jgi:SAM-dependent methyltransferase
MNTVNTFVEFFGAPKVHTLLVQSGRVSDIRPIANVGTDSSSYQSISEPEVQAYLHRAANGSPSSLCFLQRLFSSRPDLTPLLATHQLCPSWSALFTYSYDAGREELPGETAFWSELARGKASILEIGAGTGFISQHIAAHKPQSLTLVEPEIENIKILTRRMARYHKSSSLRFFPGKFQDYRGPQQDLIAFPYDSLPMIYSREERSKIFDVVARSLTAGGLFAIHVSSQDWNDNYVASHREPSISFTPASKDWPAFCITRQVIPISAALYVNKMEARFLNGSIHERFIDPVVVVSPDEIQEMAADRDLKLEAHYRDFPASENQGTDEHIFIFRK